MGWERVVQCPYLKNSQSEVEMLQTGGKWAQDETSRCSQPSPSNDSTWQEKWLLTTPSKLQTIKNRFNIEARRAPVYRLGAVSVLRQPPSSDPQSPHSSYGVRNQGERKWPAHPTHPMQVRNRGRGMTCPRSHREQVARPESGAGSGLALDCSFHFSILEWS